MDTPEKTGWALLWKGGALFLILCLIVLPLDTLFRQRELRRSGGTSFGTTPRGFRGIFEVADRLGYRVERFRRSYLSLPPPEESLLLVLDPQPWQRILRGANITVEDLYPDEIRDWIESGGVLIYAPAGRSIGAVLGVDVVVPMGDPEAGPPSGVYPVKEVEEMWGTMDCFVPSLGGAPELVWCPAAGTVTGSGPLEGESWEILPLRQALRGSVRAYLRADYDVKPRLAAFGGPISDPFRPLLLLDDSPIAIVKDLEEGVVIAFSTTYPWTNAAVGTGDAALPLFAVLDWASDQGWRTIYLDEFAHGLAIRKGLLRWIWDTDLLYVFTTCTIGIALLTWRGAFRNGPPRVDRVLPRRAKEEFVVSLADIYLRAGRPGLAAGLVLRGYEDELASLMGREPWQDPYESGPSALSGLREGLRRGRPTDGSSLLRFSRRARQAYVKARDRFRQRTGWNR